MCTPDLSIGRLSMHLQSRDAHPCLDSLHKKHIKSILKQHKLFTSPRNERLFRLPWRKKRIMRGHKRKLPADTFQHIYIRSINQFVIFYSMEDRLVYYTVFAVMTKRYRVTVLALALMFDHIHHLIKTISRELYSKFIGVTTSTFVMAYNRDSGRKGPLFHKAYGNSAKRRDKDVRNCIAYNYNNSVEKLLFNRAEQDRWNLLAYIDNPHPFSKEICSGFQGSHVQIHQALR